MTYEMLSMEELDYVIGGAVHYLFRYRKNNRGPYDAEDIRFDGDEAQWQRLIKGEKVSNIKASLTVGQLKGIKPENLKSFLDRKRKAGYVIQAC